MNLKTKYNNVRQATFELKYFLILWIGQSLSMITSSMTAFAISIWVFQESESTLFFSISILVFLLPDLVFGVFAGPLIDRANKKKVVILVDLAAGFCTLTFFFLIRFDLLQLWYVIGLNFLIGIFRSIQTPASDVMVSMLIPKKYYVKGNAAKSFTQGIAEIIAPVLAAVFIAIGGIQFVIGIDILAVILATISLLLFVKISETKKENNTLSVNTYLSDLKEGFVVVKRSYVLTRLLLFFALINLVAGITYFNLITPMLLVRTGGDMLSVSFVKSAMGIGLVLGGFIAVMLPTVKNKMQLIFLTTACSFLLGDVLFALGNHLFVWVIAGFTANVFVPILTSNAFYFWRTIVPIDLQARAFSLRNAVSSGMVALGILSGGFLTEFIFEPFMMGTKNPFTYLLGSYPGSGMTLMFLATGVLGFSISMLGYFSKNMRKAERELDDVSSKN